jgi:hypothetical protein
VRVAFPASLPNKHPVLVMVQVKSHKIIDSGVSGCRLEKSLRVAAQQSLRVSIKRDNGLTTTVQVVQRDWGGGKWKGLDGDIL